MLLLMTMLEKAEIWSAKISLRFLALNNLPHWKILACLTGIWICWETAILGFMEKGGDAVWKWRVMRCLAETGVMFPDRPDHHLGRWAVNLPVLGLMKLTGSSHFLLYYVMPLLNSLLLMFAVYLVATRLKHRAAGVAAWIGCMTIPLIDSESYQMAIMLPCAMFMLYAFWFLLNYLDRGNLLSIALCALFLGFAYGCKFTAIYWAFAFGVYLLLFDLHGKTLFRIWKFRFGLAPFVFAGMLLAVFLVETICMNNIFSVSYGRLSGMLSGHFSQTMSEYRNLFEYLLSFYRPLTIKGKYFDFMPRIFAIGGGLFAMFLIFRRGKSHKAFPLAFSFATAYLLHSYVVYKFFPFLHPEKTHGRYHLLLAAAGIILIVAACSEWRNVLEKHLPKAKSFLPIAFVFFFLFFSLLERISCWRQGDTFLRPFDAMHYMNLAQKKQIPVFEKVNFRHGKVSSETRKYAVLWMSFFLPPDRLPEIDPGKVLQKKMYRDEKGSWFIHLWGPEITEGVSHSCLVVDDFRVKNAILTLTPQTWKEQNVSGVSPQTDEE